MTHTLHGIRARAHVHTHARTSIAFCVLRIPPKKSCLRFNAVASTVRRAWSVSGRRRPVAASNASGFDSVAAYLDVEVLVFVGVAVAVALPCYYPNMNTSMS